MKNTKHTPGPWKTEYLEQNKLDGNAPCRVRANNRTVAWVDFWQDDSYATQLQIEEQRYNARLIAASPSLLEALTALLTYCEAQNYQIELDKGWGVSVMNRTRSAIARATGGQQ